MTRDRRHSEAGFGLIETLIALAIIATIMGVTFQTLASNARTTQTMIDRRMAVLVAKSALDGAIGANATSNERQAGIAGSLRWRVGVQPYLSRSGTAPALDLITVTVERADTNRPVLRLRSLRLGR